MTFKGKFIGLLVLVATFVLSGCASYEKNLATVKKNEETVRTTLDGNYNRLARTNIIEDMQGSWVSKRATAVERDLYPAESNRPVSVSYKPRGSFTNIADILASGGNLRFSYAPDVLTHMTQKILPNNFTYEGPLRGLMDEMTSRYGVSWRYNKGTVELFRYETKVFTVAALPGTTDYSATLGSESKSSSSTTGAAGAAGAPVSMAASSAGGSTGSKLEVKNKINFWDSIKLSIEKMLSPAGKFAIAESSGTVTVTDLSQNVATVEAFIKRINEDKMKQVTFKVEVYAVNLNDSDQYSIDWDLVYKTASETVKWVTPVNAATSLANLTGLITDANSKWNGSKAVLSALSQQGSTSLVNTATSTTVSGESVPVYITRETSYLASITSTAVPNAGTSTSLQPGTVTTGFTMNLLPKVLDGRNIFLQAAIELSALDAIKTVSSAGQTIQVPEKSMRSFLQKLQLKSGQTLILGGFQGDVNSVDDAGPMSPSAWFAGGYKKSTGNRISLVVMITPYLVDNAVAKNNAF